MAKGSILIGDDDVVLREVYNKKFTLAGYDIRTMSNGQEILEALKEQTPDILILDIHMPVLDGFSVLQQIPQDQRNFPVIMLSNFGDEKSKTQATQLGANDFFVKSEMTIKTLIGKVDTLMQAKQMWGGGAPAPQN